MPSTYTLNNGIELIATGEQSGTWGDTTNTNFQLLDTSLDGQVTVTLASTGSSGSPNTLPVSDGAASNGRNRLVIFDDSSDLGGTAFVQLTPSDAEKIIYVRNSLSGSRSILLFQGTYSASNDYEVPAGTTAVVFFNGAGSGAVAANVFDNAHFDNLNIAGDVTIGDDLSLNSDGAIINIGADADLQVTHSGSAGTITNATGNLTIDTTASDTDIIFKGTDGASDITALTLDMSEAGRAIFNAGLLSNNTNDIRKAQITSQYDSSSFLRLHPSATTDSGGYTNMFFGTSTDNNYGVAIGGLRAGSDSTPSFRIRTHNDSITGVDVLTINNSGVSTFRSGAVFNENSDDADFRVESNNQANMIFVDAGNDRVGIQTAIPSTTLQVDGLDDGDIAWFRGNGSNAGGRALRFGVGNTTRTEFPTYLPNIYSTSSDSANGGLAIGMYGGTSGEGAIQFWTGDSSSFAEKMRIQRAGNIVAQYGAVFNEGSNNSDFRVESDTNTHMLFVDAGNNYVIIGGSSLTNAPNAGGLGISAGGERALSLQSSSADTLILFRDSGTTVPPYIGSFGNDLAIGGYGGGSPNVGIGITSPSSYYSNDLVVQADSEGGITLSSTNTTNSNYFMFADASSGAGRYAGYVQYDHNTDTMIFATNTAPRLHLDGAEVTVNEQGNDTDFRVESDSNTHAIFLDAANNKIGISDSSPSYTLDIRQNTNDAFDGVNLQPNNQTQNMQYSFLGTTSTYFTEFMVDSTDSGTTGYRYFKFYEGTRDNNGELLYLGYDGTVFNEGGADRDFRVESDSNANMLVVDASSNIVNINSGINVNQTSLNVGGGVTISSAADDANLANGITVGAPFSNVAGGQIITCYGVQGTMRSATDIILEYRATSWKSYAWEVHVSNTFGYCIVRAGGYNNGSNPTGTTVDLINGANPLSAASQVNQNNQYNRLKLDSAGSGVHTHFRVIYSQNGADGVPKANRLFFTVNY